MTGDDHQMQMLLLGGMLDRGMPLHLPPGIFCRKGVTANVLFF